MLTLTPLAQGCIKKLVPRLVLHMYWEPNTTDGLHTGAGTELCGSS